MGNIVFRKKEDLYSHFISLSAESEVQVSKEDESGVLKEKSEKTTNPTRIIDKQEIEMVSYPSFIKKEPTGTEDLETEKIGVKAEYSNVIIKTEDPLSVFKYHESQSVSKDHESY